jgi:hypothetical protein
MVHSDLICRRMITQRPVRPIQRTCTPTQIALALSACKHNNTIAHVFQSCYNQIWVRIRRRRLDDLCSGPLKLQYVITNRFVRNETTAAIFECLTIIHFVVPADTDEMVRREHLLRGKFYTSPSHDTIT